MLCLRTSWYHSLQKYSNSVTCYVSLQQNSNNQVRLQLVANLKIGLDLFNRKNVIAFSNSKSHAQRSKLDSKSHDQRSELAVFCFLVQLLPSITKALPCSNIITIVVLSLFHTQRSQIVRCLKRTKLKQSSMQTKPISAYLETPLEASRLKHLQRTRLVILLSLIAQIIRKGPFRTMKLQSTQHLHKYFQINTFKQPNT